ncbi:MAG: hypothetical protein ABIQ66_02245 [Novosphingobium sp.]
MDGLAPVISDLINPETEKTAAEPFCSKHEPHGADGVVSVLPRLRFRSSAGRHLDYRGNGARVDLVRVAGTGAEAHSTSRGFPRLAE